MFRRRSSIRHRFADAVAVAAAVVAVAAAAAAAAAAAVVLVLVVVSNKLLYLHDRIIAQYCKR